MAKDAQADIDKIMKTFNKKVGMIKGNTVKGFNDAGKILIREAQLNVPVEHGVLKASGYVRPAQGDPNAVEVGFSAKYAAAVHEKTPVNEGKPRPSGLGVYWGPNGHPHYLTLAIVDTWSAMLDAIRNRAKVK